MPAGVYYDGDFSIPSPIGPVRTENPFDFMPHIQIYRQPFCQLASNFAPLPLNTPMARYDPVEAPAITGTWTLKFKGQQTSALAAKATAAAVQTALNALSTVLPGSVEVTGDWDHGYAVAFHPNAGQNMLAGQNLLAANMSGIAPAFKANVQLISKGPAIQSVRPLTVDTTGAHSTGALLVQESNRQDMGAGIVTWERVYANIPDTYVEYQGYNYQMQRMQTYHVLWSSWTDVYGARHDQYVNFIRLSEYTEPLTATVGYSFGTTAQLGKAKNPFYIPYRIIHYTDSFGFEYVYSIGQWGVAEATSAEHWMGDIWRVRTVYVAPY